MNRGFTLIEFLIYIGIVSVALVIAGAIGLNILFGKAKLTAIDEVSQNARFSLEKISDRIRNAELINSPAQGATSTLLSLQMASSSLNPTIFDISSSTLRIKEGSDSAINLTSDEVEISDLQFHNISYSSTPGTVRVQLTLNSINPEDRQEYDFEKTFYASANIRKK